jgi:hypothetical protein
MKMWLVVSKRKGAVYAYCESDEHHYRAEKIRQDSGSRQLSNGVLKYECNLAYYADNTHFVFRLAEPAADSPEKEEAQTEQPQAVADVPTEETNVLQRKAYAAAGALRDKLCHYTWLHSVGATVASDATLPSLIVYTIGPGPFPCPLVFQGFDVRLARSGVVAPAIA